LNKLKVSISNPGLGSHVRQTVRAYEEVSFLDNFYTTFLLNNTALHAKLSNRYKGLKSKQFNEISSKQIKKLMLPELLRLMSSKFLSADTTDKIWEWSELYFDQWVAKQLNSDIDIFHGYEHASLFSLQKCKQEKIFSVYEQPSVHHSYFNEKVVSLLLEKEKYFQDNFQSLYDSDLSKRRNERRDEELKIANLILCNSTYVKTSLLNAGVDERKILVHPLGFPEVKPVTIKEKTSLTFMMSGNISYLKGSHHVLRVWKNNPELFNSHQLVCIGNDTLSPSEWDGLPNNVKKLNRLANDEYLKEVEKADVYILNTYSDGFGMVMSEAMAKGLAVIGTTNSAAPDVIQDSINGKIIPIANEASLLQSMKWMIDHPNELVRMRMAAMDYAKNHSWENYRNILPIRIQDKYNTYKTNG
jgi:glycosyltransferase involved in cell wall biosynthesis